jgi:hypothetical protein
MIVCRAAIVLLVVACAADTGCRTPTHPQSRSDPITPPVVDAILQTPYPSDRADKTYTIVFATFIPANHLVAPLVHPQSYGGFVPPMPLAFAGDDRGFDVDAISFRAKQEVTVIPDETEDSDGLMEGSKWNYGGITESFDARLALADGRIDDGDRIPAPGGRQVKRREIAVNTEGMIIDGPVRRGPHCVFIRLRTGCLSGPRNRLIAGSPSIDWDIGITIDTSGPEPIYEVAGRWDGYPAAELYIQSATCVHLHSRRRTRFARRSPQTPAALWRSSVRDERETHPSIESHLPEVTPYSTNNRADADPLGSQPLAVAGLRLAQPRWESARREWPLVLAPRRP